MDSLAASHDPIPPGLWNDVVSWGVFWPALVCSHLSQWKVMPTPKTCSQISFIDIQTSFESNFTTVKEVWHSISVCQSKLIYFILCVRYFDHNDFRFFFSKFYFLFLFFLLYLMLEDPQKILMLKISFSFNVRNSFTRSWQIPKETKSWILMNLVLFL